MNPSSNQNTPFYVGNPDERPLVALAQECEIPGSCYPDDGNEGEALPTPGAPDPGNENHIGLPGFKTKGAETSLPQAVARAFAWIGQQLTAPVAAGELAFVGAR